ncbi:MAG: hypothetical protein N3D11_11710 [Candidatus Sumerlaeia bacterium]|nr:hypothetical protein [Candidatus Sumerlaeia bacterium]
MIYALSVRLCALICFAAIQPLLANASENLAWGKRVVFSPAPNYELTARGNTDATDLTDGKHSSRVDHRLWFDTACVGYSYAGLVQLAVDLGAVQPVDEVTVRFQGGSPQAGVALPGWVDVLASEDGDTYYKVASYSKWRSGDKERFGIPRDEGKAWVHTLRFSGLQARARWVGLSFYTTALTVLDEMAVLKADGDASRRPFDDTQRSDFSVVRPRMYFHKPTVFISTNIPTPNPIGLILPPGKPPVSGEIELDLPEGLQLLGGWIGGTAMKEINTNPVRDSEGVFMRANFSVNFGRANKDWGRIYLGGNWPNGKRGFLRYRLQSGGTWSPRMKQPVEAIEIPAVQPPKRLIAGLGWWPLSATLSWPDGLRVFHHLGLNTLPLFGRYPEMKAADSLAFVEKARGEGFKIMNIDSPLHAMLGSHKRAGELYCQFGDGKQGTQLCPSYRGPLYRAELERLAGQTAAVKADFLSCDIELWGWRGPQDSPKCSRCKADFAQSGCKDWDEWYLLKGGEMWTDLSNAVRRAMAEKWPDRRNVPFAGIEIGGYDFRPGINYQSLWPFDRLYPAHMQNSQVSTYTPLEPYHVGLVGDEARADRVKLPRSDVMPWITPGDAGTFPGEMFRWALLECFANGSKGVHFWSSRVWDTEDLAAYAEALRIAGQVEDIIVDGELLTGTTSQPPVRLSGMRKGNEVFLLAADYFSTASGTVTVQLPSGLSGIVTDLRSGRQAGHVRAPDSIFTFAFDGEKARAFRIRP